MSRFSRQVGIRTAQVRLPQHQSAGPALVKTASTLADQAFAKQADKRTQEAQIAAKALNFERDGDGNLIAPNLPMSDQGLLAPSIYDRAYTEMVGQRYMQQTNIDTAERLNLIATETRFDPIAYRELAENYVAKVTELAPDYLKADVNNTAQIKMVEHYNHIIRQRAERDHTEARGVHLQSIDATMKEMTGYVEAGADAETIGAKMMEVRALIEQGDGLNFWLDDEKADMVEDMDRAFAVSGIITEIQNAGNDPLEVAEHVQRMSEFILGEGTISMVDELGNIAQVPIDEIPMSAEERTLVGEHAIQVLKYKQGAFTGLQDARLERKSDEFVNWWSKHSLRAATDGTPIDMERLYEEYDKAHNDVLVHDYDDTLREEIRGIIMDTFGSGSMSQWREDFLPGWAAYNKRYEEEITSRLGGRDKESLSVEELRDLEHGARMAIGNVAGGNVQSADGAREIGDFYGGMTGRDYTQDAFEQLIAGGSGSAGWDELKWNIDTHMSKIGIWPKALSDAIVGKINAPGGMNVDTLQSTLDLARMFYDNPTFKNNMTDENALGSAVGGALQHLFKYGGQPTVANVTKHLENYSDPNFRPQAAWEARPPEDRQRFNDQAKAAIERRFVSTWRTLWKPKGQQVQGFGFNPFDDDLAGVPQEVMFDVMQVVQANAGFIDTSDPDSFDPFVHRTVDRVLKDKGYSPSKMGYSPTRHDDQYNSHLFDWTKGWERPDSAIVQFPPEYFGRDEDGNLDPHLMNFTQENFQIVLDHYGNKQGQKWIVDESAALVYNAQASTAAGYPRWDIKLLHQGGGSEFLTNGSGPFEGDRVLFDMRYAHIQNTERKQRISDATNRGVRLRRSAFQNPSASGNVMRRGPNR